MNQPFIPLSVPNLKGNEKAYTNKAIETEWVSTGGPYVNQFENVLADYVHTPAAVSCQNGTSGIHIALLLAGVTHVDEVIVPTLTFIAAVNPVRYVGAEPVFMDCDDTLCMDADKLELFCREECRFVNDTLIDNNTDKPIKAMIVVHVFGEMANLKKILSVAEMYNIVVIEDATEALGTYYLRGDYSNQYAGALGQMGVYSFNGNKIITTGGGGMMVSKDDNILKRAKHLTTQAKSDDIYFIHDEVGYNYRLTNLQAALGLAQMEQLESFIKTKIDNYHLYQEKIDFIPGVYLLAFRSDVRSNHWFYSLFIEDGFPYNQKEVIAELANNNIQARPIWGLIHEQLPYIGFRTYQIEKAVNYQRHIVNIPCSTNLTIKDINRVVACIKRMAK